MTLEETLDIYRHLLNSADSLQMAYVCLKKHNAMEDAMCGRTSMPSLFKSVTR